MFLDFFFFLYSLSPPFYINNFYNFIFSFVGNEKKKKKRLFLFIGVMSFFLLPKKISISSWKHWLFFLHAVSLCECSSFVELVPCFCPTEFSQVFGDSQGWAHLCQLQGPSSVWERGFCSPWLPSCLW